MTLKYWIMAIRPRTLPAAIAPLLLGNVLAYSHDLFAWAVAISSMSCAVLLQIAVNLANDYFDHQSGVDTEARLGPTRVTQAGLLKPKQVRNGMILSLVLAILVGLYLIYVGGWPVALLALFAVAGALGYSGGPYPLASHGLGEVAAFVYFGLVAVVGSYFIQAGETSAAAWLLGSAMGGFNAAIMLVNNTRDITTDIDAGKRTLAVRVGLENARLAYRAMLWLPFLLLLGGFLLGLIPGIVALLGTCAWPIARILADDFCHQEGGALNPLLGRTAQLTLMYSALTSFALWLSSVSNQV